jgi:polysaccharide pyruvyl transferase WcaK-like protein
LPRWRAALAEADLAIIGGGNLFQDDCLNFPLKIGAVLEACKLANVPVAIHAVGVVRGWSDAARVLFSRVREVRLVAASARDDEACEAWRAELGVNAPPITLARDPGLLAMCLAHDPIPKPISARPVVGFGVTHPVVLRHHAAPGAIVAGSFEATLALVEELLARGMRIVLFGNGAGEDEKRLRRLARHPFIQRHISSGLVSVALRPRTPSDLVATIAMFDCVLAHRLHALVVATALGLPAIALGWDPKVGGFFRSIGYPRRAVEDQRLSVQDIAGIVRATISEGVDKHRLETLVEETRRTIVDLASINLDYEPLRRSCASG